MEAGLECFYCKNKTRNYSKSQRKKGSKRKCTYCITNPDYNKPSLQNSNGSKTAWLKCMDFPVPSAKKADRFLTHFLTKSGQAIYHIFQQ